MNDEQMQSRLETLYRDRVVPRPEVQTGVARVMTDVPQVRQRSRWWPFPIFYRRTQTPATVDTIEYQPNPIPATDGHTPTVIGRTSSMLSPAKAITAGALVFAIGGMMLIAQPFDQSGGGVPGATTDEERAVPVKVTGTSVEGDCPGGSSTIDGRVEKNRGYVCRQTWSTSDQRLDGTYTRAWNLDFDHGYGLDYGYATGRLENADGAWQQRPGLRAGMNGQSEPWDGVELVVFDGEDDYAGLFAMVFMVYREDDAELDPAQLNGFIVDADYPPSDFLAE